MLEHGVASDEGRASTEAILRAYQELMEQSSVNASDHTKETLATFNSILGHTLATLIQDGDILATPSDSTTARVVNIQAAAPTEQEHRYAQVLAEHMQTLALECGGGGGHKKREREDLYAPTSAAVPTLDSGSEREMMDELYDAMVPALENNAAATGSLVSQLMAAQSAAYLQQHESTQRNRAFWELAKEKPAMAAGLFKW